MEMNLQMKIPNPQGYVFYIGADGFDAFPDANGWLWFADDFKSATEKGYFKAHVYRTNGTTTERINLPEEITGAIRLNWTPAGLFASGSYQAIEGGAIEARVFQITEYAQFTNNFPVVQTVTVEKTIDQGARDFYNATNAKMDQSVSIANSAKSLAENAYNNAKDAQNQAGQARSAAANAYSLAASKPSITDVWNKINDRLFLLIDAIEFSKRDDALNTRWQDVLFKKTNDWIYGKLRDYKLIP